MRAAGIAAMSDRAIYLVGGASAVITLSTLGMMVVVYLADVALRIVRRSKLTILATRCSARLTLGSFPPNHPKAPATTSALWTAGAYFWGCSNWGS